MLRAKKILLVGPEATFHLHSLWLHDLSKYFNTSRKCLGPEFCTFHHACLDGALEASLSTTRVKKVPGSRELAAYESCILRFILSTTLYASNNPRDPAFTTPIIDQRTGIRTKNAFWMNQARKTDLLILNRGPVPAPAWTYYFSQKTMAGNWTFVDDLCSNASTKYFDLDNLYPQRSYHRYKRGICIINAALHATLSIFLPGIMETLTAIQKDAAIRTKNIVWHGTWYLNPTCTSYGSPKGFSVEPQLLPYDESMYMVDPWTLYYNAQVYMHDKLLSILLPHVGIVYLPLSFPLAPANVTYKGTKRGQKNLFEEERKECIRYPFEEPEGRALEAAFLGGLVKILEQYSTCAISDALVKLGVRNGGHLSDIHMMSPGPYRLDPIRICGPAYTVKMVFSSDVSAPTLTEHFIDTVPPKSVVVLDVPQQAKNAVWGGLMTAGAQARQAAGVVISGRCRDIGYHRLANFPVFARAQSTLGMSHFTRPSAVNVPLLISNSDGDEFSRVYPPVTILPGDWIVADEEGVVCVPRALEERVIELAAEVEEVDASCMEDIKSGKGIQASFKKHRGK
ncbi:hypothetical protein APHAL10511_003753 [Amanita phalloides]|nr:hypothetical protein APHAL10511_003753 [Amanita phalloides]